MRQTAVSLQSPSGQLVFPPEHGYAEPDCQKVAGGNVYRVFVQVGT